MRRPLNHTHVSQKKKTKEKRKKRAKNWIPNMPNESQTSSIFQSQGMRNKKLCPVELLMPVEPLRSVCDSLAVIRLKPLQFSGRPPANGITGLGAQNLVLCLFCRASPGLSTSDGEGAMEKKVWRVGPICAMENLGMVGGLSPQFGPQLLSITPDLRLSPWVLGAKLGVSPSPGNPWGGQTFFSASLALFSRPGLEPALEMLARPPTKRPGLGRGPTIPFEIVTIWCGRLW